MQRPTGLLIVLLLVGHPGVSLACELWCTTRTADTHHGTVGCRSASDAEGTGQHVVAAGAECHDARGTIVFLNEGRQPDTRPVTTASPAHWSLANFAGRHAVDEGVFAFIVQLSDPPAFRPVLRI